MSEQIKTETTFEGVTGKEIGDINLCKRVAECLNKHYPGHLWATFINDDELGGVMNIMNLAHSSRWGYVLKLSRLYQDPDLKCVMRAGGEMLERAAMERGRWNGEVAKHIEGIRPQDQPTSGGIII